MPVKVCLVHAAAMRVYVDIMIKRSTPCLTFVLSLRFSRVCQYSMSSQGDE